MLNYLSDKILILLFVATVVFGPALITVIGITLAISRHKQRTFKQKGME